MTGSALPPQFAELEPFADWALGNETARRQRRMSSSMAELRRFYDAMLPRLDDALAYLNLFDLAALPGREKALLQMAIAMTEVAVAVEVIRDPGIPDGIDPDRLVAQHDW